jgi:Skp family chaperone for outer membrane proteins
MTLSKTLLTAISAIALMSPAAGALAQTAAKAKPKAAASTAAAPAPAAAPQAPPPLQLGPGIPGVCVFSEEAAVSRSSAGKTINDRMQQLAAQVQAELGPEQTSLDADIKAFKALAQDQQQAQGPALQQRVQTFEGKRQLRQRELETTLRKAIARVDGELEPIIRDVVAVRSCGLLLKADNAVYAANPTMDITASVVEKLNTKLPSVTFDREHLDAQAPAAQR